MAGLGLQLVDALDVWLDASLQQQDQKLELPIRCYDHGCNGRTFSSKGNYQRHWKEKNGIAPKFLCPACGQIFSRPSARNKHYKEKRCFNIPRGIPMHQAPFIIPSVDSTAAPILVIPDNNNDHVLAPIVDEASSTLGTAGDFGSSSTSGSDLDKDDFPALYDPFYDVDQASSTAASISDINTSPTILYEPSRSMVNQVSYPTSPTFANSWTHHEIESTDGGSIRCFEHGCAGRSFSTLGNYRRHRKERSGCTAQFLCSRCGRIFSRSTARNIHERKGNCSITMS